MKKSSFLSIILFLTFSHCSSDKSDKEERKFTDPTPKQKTLFPSERTPEILKKYSSVYKGKYHYKNKSDDIVEKPDGDNKKNDNIIYYNIFINYSSDNKIIVRAEKNSNEYLCTLYEKWLIEEYPNFADVFLILLSPLVFSDMKDASTWKFTGDGKSTGNLDKAQRISILFKEYESKILLLEDKYKKELSSNPFLILDTENYIFLDKKSDEPLPSFDELNSSCFK